MSGAGLLEETDFNPREPLLPTAVAREANSLFDLSAAPPASSQETSASSAAVKSGLPPPVPLPAPQQQQAEALRTRLVKEFSEEVDRLRARLIAEFSCEMEKIAAGGKASPARSQSGMVAHRQRHARPLDRVTLNVGGTAYTTGRATLLSVPGTAFPEILASPPDDDDDDDDGRIFIDRDGTNFGHVLNFLRDPEAAVVPSDEETRRKLLVEAKYYKISGLVAALSGKPSHPHQHVSSSPVSLAPAAAATAAPSASLQLSPKKKAEDAPISLPGPVPVAALTASAAAASSSAAASAIAGGPSRSPSLICQWDEEHKHPSIAVYGSCIVKGGSKNDDAVILAKPAFGTSGRHRVTFLIAKKPKRSCYYFGVVKAGFRDFSANLSAHRWAWVYDDVGNVSSNSIVMGHYEPLPSGTKIEILADMDRQSLTFFVNGNKIISMFVPKCELIPAVSLYNPGAEVCFFDQ